jgi:hypothetical protein
MSFFAGPTPVARVHEVSAQGATELAHSGIAGQRVRPLIGAPCSKRNPSISNDGRSPPGREGFEALGKTTTTAAAASSTRRSRRTRIWRRRVDTARSPGRGSTRAPARHLATQDVHPRRGAGSTSVCEKRIFGDRADLGWSRAVRDRRVVGDGKNRGPAREGGDGTGLPKAGWWVALAAREAAGDGIRRCRVSVAGRRDSAFGTVVDEDRSPGRTREADGERRPAGGRSDAARSASAAAAP